jgi:hypothetical protein
VIRCASAGFGSWWCPFDGSWQAADGREMIAHNGAGEYPALFITWIRYV